LPIRRTLLAWYGRNRRDLPWRRTSDPYSIWISEIMLQQTRVAAALPYYERFLARFPTVRALAAAPEQELLAAWAGLGYYSRARNVHKAARAMAASGDFPRDYETIRALPGVGDYTAAAVASIAFGLPFAAVDGNVLRVLSRVTAESGDIMHAATRKRLASVAGNLLDRNRPGDFNQALMELGATVCLPHTPQCGVCPVARHCAAFQSGRESEFPIRTKPAARAGELQTLFYIQRGSRVLMWQRPRDSRRLAGFWELPGQAQVPHARIKERIAEFRHTMVHTTYSFRLVRASIGRVAGGLVWVMSENLNELPLSATTTKALRCLGNRTCSGTK
jgi:A/G-specific adenine glycosylase